MEVSARFTTKRLTFYAYMWILATLAYMIGLVLPEVSTVVPRSLEIFLGIIYLTVTGFLVTTFDSNITYFTKIESTFDSYPETIISVCLLIYNLTFGELILAGMCATFVIFAFLVESTESKEAE